jgi:hypothetical protein
MLQFRRPLGASIVFAAVLAAPMFAQVETPAPQAAPTPQEAAPTEAKPAADVKPATTDTEAPPDKRVFGVLPNYRTANASEVYTPISAKYKLTIAAKDSFDYPLLMLAGAFAGLGQLTNQNPGFGQGMAGFGRRVATGYADQAIGNMLTEGFMPILLHEDPRYFRIGAAGGSKMHRTGYALTRIFVTRTDSGGTRFNFSEWVGNATGVAISNSYLPDQRNVSDNVSKLLTQCATDAISQVLKEFWPDIKQKLFHKNSADTTH